MKKGFVIKSLVIAGTIITISFGTSEALATMNLATRCEDNFVGQVFSVTDSQAPLSFALAKVQVEFTIVNEQDEDNAEKDSQRRSISVVKGGPHQFEIGQRYDVGLNNGFVCRMNRHRS